MQSPQQKAGMGLGICVLVVVGVVGIVAFLVWGVPAIRRKMMQHKSWQPKNHGHGPVKLPPNAVSGAIDPLDAGRRRSNRATGYTADSATACYGENMVGSQQFAVSQKGGNVAGPFPSAPLGSKAVPLGTSKASNGLHTTPIDLSNYARMGSDRALAAVGLDAPEDLALASSQLGHLEFAGNTRMDLWYGAGETPYSWVPHYTMNSTGRLEPGQGAQIPDGAAGPYSLAQGAVGT